MGFHLQIRRYRLALRTTVRTAREVWTERQGLYVRLEDEAGLCGHGEIAPIPGFGTETVERAEAAVRALGEWPTEDQLEAVPATLGCVRHALATARETLRRAAQREKGVSFAESATTPGEAASGVAVPDPSEYRAVAALLPAGRPALARLPAHADVGFRSFKWKVGVGDLADELVLLDDLCAALPKGAKLRLDANGAWDRRQAQRWLERCAERPVEFVEQPCFAGKAEGATAIRRAEDTLLGLAHEFPTPLALDESVVASADVTRWLEAAWPGWFVIKPTLLANPEDTLAQLARVRATVVFSSALETALGARAALERAFAWSGEPKALGFGVWPLFVDPRFDGPAAAPFIRREDIQRIDEEELWNALS